MPDAKERREALEEIIRRLEAAKQHLESTNTDLSYITTARSAARAVLSMTRKERDKIDT